MKKRSVAVFVALGGFSLLLGLLMNGVVSRLKHRAWISPGKYSRLASRQLARKLDLSPDQAGALRELLKKQKSAGNSINLKLIDAYDRLAGAIGAASNKELVPLLAEIDTLHKQRSELIFKGVADVRGVLSAEQQPKYTAHLHQTFGRLKSRIESYGAD